MTDPYAAHADFIRPARATPELWRVLLVIILFEAVFAASPLIAVAFLPGEAAVETFYAGTTALSTLAQFLLFGISGLGLAVVVQMVHGRSVRTLIGPLGAARRDLARVAGAVAVWLAVLELLPPWIDIYNLAEVRDFITWLLLVPVALLALFVQVATEEMFFRGYLQQQFACISNRRWAWMVVPSVMFGALHFWNGNGVAEGTLWAIWATVLGIACADLTARTGNLGAAIGLHLTNNAFAVLIVAVQGWPSSGLALFLYPYEDPDLYRYGAAVLLEPWVIVQLLSMLLSVAIMWLAARIAIKR